MNKEYYNKVYIPGIVKWGKITMLLGIITCFGPALVISVVYGCMPPVSAIIAGTIAQISVSGAFYIVEPISYFPILGIPGTYLTFLSGNTSNMRVPCSSVAQEAAGVEMGSDKGSVVSTIGIAVSIIVNIVILTIGAIAGNAIIGMMPEGFKQALNFLLSGTLRSCIRTVRNHKTEAWCCSGCYRICNELADEKRILILLPWNTVIRCYPGSRIWIYFRRKDYLQERA